MIESSSAVTRQQPASESVIRRAPFVPNILTKPVMSQSASALSSANACWKPFWRTPHPLQPEAMARNAQRAKPAPVPSCGNPIPLIKVTILKPLLPTDCSLEVTAWLADPSSDDLVIRIGNIIDSKVEAQTFQRPP